MALNMIGFKVLFSFVFLLNGVTEISCCRYVFKINQDVEEITERLLYYDFKDMLKITPNVYSFEFARPHSNYSIQTVLSKIKFLFGDKIAAIEQVKTNTKWFHKKTTPLLYAGQGRAYFSHLQSEPKSEESANYFGMHVEDAWNKGYNGSGVKVAVVDIGVNANIPDLHRNLDMTLAYNFIDNTSNVTPEGVVYNYKAESIRKIEHGNRCTSIVAAEKGNDLCNAGIAFDARVVPLKIFSLSHAFGMFKVRTRSDVIAAALAYRPEDIHIYSNSWSPEKKFEPLDLAEHEAILYGATHGRNKLGAIYVVPDGSDGITGSSIANSLHTIAVNGVGVGGTLTSNSEVSACVITSGLSEGNRLNTKYMTTSSYSNVCSKDFKGVSAAVAQVSGIIALILHARPDLTVRDIQLVLAESSDREGLAEREMFKPNGAGKYFHYTLGYGLLNADKAVSLAKTWKSVGKLHHETLEQVKSFGFRYQNHLAGFKWVSVIEFKMTEDPCRPRVNTIEHVMLRIGHHVIKQEGVLIVIVSPNNTESIIVDNTDAKNIDLNSSRRNLSSTHFIGESPIGTWKVKIRLGRILVSKHLKEPTSLIVYGTVNEKKRFPTDRCPPSTNKPTVHKDITTKSNKEITPQSESTSTTKSAVTVSKRTNRVLYAIMCVFLQVLL